MKTAEVTGIRLAKLSPANAYKSKIEANRKYLPDKALDVFLSRRAVLWIGALSTEWLEEESGELQMGTAESNHFQTHF